MCVCASVSAYVCVCECIHACVCVCTCVCVMCVVVLHDMAINIEYHNIFIVWYDIMNTTILSPIPYNYGINMINDLQDESEVVYL